MLNVSLTELSGRFSYYINRVSYRGESFTLFRGKKAVAELRPVPSGRTLKELRALLDSLPKLTGQELNDFGEDLKEIRKPGNQEELGQP